VQIYIKICQEYKKAGPNCHGSHVIFYI